MNMWYLTPGFDPVPIQRRLNPSIRPPSMATSPERNMCPTSVARSGALTRGTYLHEGPAGGHVPYSGALVAPLAPGNLPNISSNVRFSLIRKTTCLIRFLASVTSLALVGDAEDASVAGGGDPTVRELRVVLDGDAEHA